MRCTCDDFGDSPCPEHGYGEMVCSCGKTIRAPLLAEGREAECPHCFRRYHTERDRAKSEKAFKWVHHDNVFLAREEDMNGAPNWNGPGWYFWDETGDANGPFGSRLEAEKESIRYGEMLNRAKTENVSEDQRIGRQS